MDHVIQDCVNLINILSEPSNRIALEAELSLAGAWYQGYSYRDPTRVEIPDTPQPKFNFSDASYHVQCPEMPELPWAGGIREFPFISICLRLGLNRNSDTRLHDVQEQSLGTVFQDDKVEYGMVVLDISDLDRVRYGIVGHAINYMAEVVLNVGDEWDPVEDEPPREETVPVIEEHRSRVPLSFAIYMKKFRPHDAYDFNDGAKEHNKLPLVEVAALDCR